MNHLESCVRRATEVRTKRLEYNRQFPFHCRFCEGWGGTVTLHDPSLGDVVRGDGLTPEIDPCNHCILQGRCPRCGSTVTDFDEPCDFCGFEEGTTEGKPYPHECLCAKLESEYI